MQRLTTFLLILLMVSTASTLCAQQPRINDVTCSLQDSEGCWWYGTQGGGLCRDDGRRIEVWRSDREHPELLGSNDVTCLAECGARGEIWFGTKKGAYALLRQGGSPRAVLPTELADKRLNCMLEGRERTMWVAYRNQLLELDIQTDSVMRRFELEWEGRRRAIVAMTMDSSGTLWLSLWNGGLCRLQRGQTGFSPIEWHRDGYCSELRFDLVRNCIVAETSTGERLMVRRGANVAVPDMDASGRIQAVLSEHAPRRDTTYITFAETTDSIFYIGTYHSLYRYVCATDSLQRLPFEPGRVRDVVIASDGRAFFLSNQLGLCMLRGDSVEVLSDDVNLRSLELRGDTILWLTDGVGNASTFDLRTRRLAHIDVPETMSPGRKGRWLWWLLLAVFPLLYFLIRRVRRTAVTADEVPTEVAQKDGEHQTETDRLFIEQATTAVESHLSESDYSVDQLASDMCMSRATLYRRLRQVCGESPIDFIRNVRLDRAADLLRTTGRNVNEVSDLVGFAYASYFARCFKKRFGVSPKEYGERHGGH